jgi:hypothetical protein
MALFQVFFIPTGIMYWLASRTSPKDIGTVQAMLNERAEEVAAAHAATPSPTPSSPTPSSSTPSSSTPSWPIKE